MPRQTRNFYSDGGDHSAFEIAHKIALGEYQHVTQDRKFTHATVGSVYDVVSNGNILWIPDEGVAHTVRVAAGGSVVDANGGVGAWSLRIMGLDVDHVEIYDDVVLDGANVSTTTTEEFHRVNRAIVLQTGANEVNFDDILIETSDGLEDVALVGADQGQSEIGHIIVPKGKALLAKHLALFADANKSVDVRIIVRDTTGVRRSIQQMIGLSGPSPIEFLSPNLVPEMVELWLEAKVTSGTGDLSAWLDYLFVDVGSPTASVT
jgi:hypothetical protein